MITNFEEYIILGLKQIFDENKLAQYVVAYKQNNKNAKALWALHYCYEQGWRNVIINRDKAIIFLKAAAQEGHAGASYKLAKYFSNFDDTESLILLKHYTSKMHIQMCIDKTYDCNDEPYYNQQDYIILLERFENQTPKIAVTKIRHRVKP